MHVTYDVQAAESLARSLGAFLDSNSVPVSPELLRNAIAATQGHASWSAFADATKPEALDSQLQRWERAHILGSRGDQYGEELEMPVHTGYGLRYDASSEGPTYVRALDPLGREIGYWDCEEWREEPSGVMRQILDSLLRGRPLQRRLATTVAPGTDQDGMVLLSSLECRAGCDAVSSESI